MVVKELPDNPNHSYITPKGLRNTKALLKETLENEGETYSGNEDIGGAADDEETEGIFFTTLKDFNFCYNKAHLYSVVQVNYSS